jgi:hypothetical protein
LLMALFALAQMLQGNQAPMLRVDADESGD